MSVKLASAEYPSDKGSAGFKWAVEEQHCVPLFNTIPEVPMVDLPRPLRISCARLRQRLCRKHCRERDVVRCFEYLNWLAGRTTQFLLQQEVHARVRKLVDERCDRASAIPLPQAAFRELLGSRSVYGPDGNSNLANFSTWCLSLSHFLGAVVSAMSCLRARATTWRICRA